MCFPKVGVVAKDKCQKTPPLNPCPHPPEIKAAAELHKKAQLVFDKEFCPFLTGNLDGSTASSGLAHAD